MSTKSLGFITKLVFEACKNLVCFPRCASTISSKRTQGRVMKLSDQALLPGAKMRYRILILNSSIMFFCKWRKNTSWLVFLQTTKSLTECRSLRICYCDDHHLSRRSKLSPWISGFKRFAVVTKICSLFLCQTLFLSEENKDEVKLEMLDELALHQMQKIKVRVV